MSSRLLSARPPTRPLARSPAAAARPQSATLLRHSFLLSVGSIFEAKERLARVSPCVGWPGGPIALPPSEARPTQQSSWAIADLVEVVRKVQKFRFWSALKNGQTRLDAIPKANFDALAAQIGFDGAYVARVFNKYQLK
jgi:hypothetical protein